MLITAMKEEEVIIDEYSKLTAVLKPSFKNMIPHFISKRIINFDEKSTITVEDLLDKVMNCLKHGDTKHFYAMLDIMKNHGNFSVEELANDMEKRLSL